MASYSNNDNNNEDDDYNQEESIENFGFGHITFKKESDLLEDEDIEAIENLYDDEFLDEDTHEELNSAYANFLPQSTSIPSTSTSTEPTKIRNKRKQELFIMDRDDSIPQEVLLQDLIEKPPAYAYDPTCFKRREKTPLYMLDPEAYAHDPQKQYQIRRAIITFRHHQDKKRKIDSLTKENKRYRQVVDNYAKREAEILAAKDLQEVEDIIKSSNPAEILSEPLPAAPPLPPVPPLPQIRRQNEHKQHQGHYFGERIDAVPLIRPELPFLNATRRFSNKNSSVTPDAEVKVVPQEDPLRISTRPNPIVVGEATREKILQLVQKSGQIPNGNSSTISEPDSNLAKQQHFLAKAAKQPLNGDSRVLPSTSTSSPAVKQEPRAMTVSEMMKAQKIQQLKQKEQVAPAPVVQRNGNNGHHPPPSASKMPRLSPQVQLQKNPVHIAPKKPPPPLKPQSKPAPASWSSVVVKEEPLPRQVEFHDEALQVPDPIPFVKIKEEPVDRDESSSPCQRKSTRTAALNRTNAKDLLNGIIRKTQNKKSWSGVNSDDEDELVYARPGKGTTRRN